jgi:hypothetical protein
MNLTTYKSADKPFLCTVAQAETLDRLAALHKGGIGSVTGYRPTTGYVEGKSPVVDMQIITRFETGKLYARKKAALAGITFADVAEDIAKAPKLKALSAADCLAQFNACKEAAMASLDKTLTGDRDDAHRQGHDRCYARVADGVKVNLVTEKDADGLMQPVLKDGLPQLASIMLSYLELNKTIRVPGEYKTVNSGPKVLMDKIIESKLNARSVGFKTLSLKEGNFESLKVSKQTITPDDLKTVEVAVSKSKLIALLDWRCPQADGSSGKRPVISRSHRSKERAG